MINNFKKLVLPDIAEPKTAIFELTRSTLKFDCFCLFGISYLPKEHISNPLFKVYHTSFHSLNSSLSSESKTGNGSRNIFSGTSYLFVPFDVF